MGSFHPALAVLMFATIACAPADDPGAAAQAPAVAVKAATSPSAPLTDTPTPAIPASVDVTPTAPTAPTPPAAPTDPAERFRLALAPLVDGTKPDAKAAWADYKAGRFAQARRGFAAVAIAEPTPWKHPFNLACAAARASDEDVARIGLAEAVRRGGAAAVSKARHDADLADLRSATWFEPVMRGEDTTPPTATAVASAVPPPVATTATAVPGEPDELPGTDAAIDRELEGAELKTVVAKLAEVHGVRVAVRGTLLLSTPDGHREAFVVYDYSLYQECLTTADKKTCRKQLGATSPDESPDNQMACTHAWLARISIGDDSKALERSPLALGCEIQKVLRLTALDLDGDGAHEVLVDVIGTTQWLNVRDEGSDDERLVKVLRRDGTVQLEFRSEWRHASMDGSDVATRIYFVDTDGDRHADVVAQRTEVEHLEGVDADLWPGDRDDGPAVRSTITRYDPTTDSWPGFAVPG